MASVILGAQEFNFRTYGSAEGLANLSVQMIYQDHLGFIWVSTENGIFRFDGERFEAFGAEHGLPSNSTMTFGNAPDGNLLVGGEIGLYYQSGNHFEKLSIPFKKLGRIQGIQSDGKGHTFLGTDAGLIELSAKPKPEPGGEGFEVRRIAQAPGASGPDVDGVLVEGDIVWYGCGLELCRMDRHRTRVYGRESGIPQGKAIAIRKDCEGNLWVTLDLFNLASRGMFELKADQSRFQRVNLPLSAAGFYNVPTLDADGRILLSTSDGLFIHDKNDWQKIDREAGLRGHVNTVFEDRQHSLWIGLEGRGLALWRGYREWESYSFTSGLTSDLIFEILPQANRALWVATEAGLFRGEHQQVGWAFKKIAGLSNFPVHSIQRDLNGNLWVGTTARGVACLHVQTGRVEWFGERQGLPAREPLTLRFDHQQQLWVATEAGLFVSKAPYKKFSRVTALPSTRIWTVAEGSDGTIWAGGIDGLFENTAGHWENLTRANGLSNQVVLSIGAGPNGAVWVGYRYGGGIDRIYSKLGRKQGDVTIEKVIQRPGSDGLVNFLNFDSSGRLWAGTERGVDMLDGSWWNHYDMSNGLVWEDCNLNAFAEDLDGSVWIGTSGGLSHFKPLHRNTPTVPIEVDFTGIIVGKSDVSELHNPSFGFHSNSLVAHYAALNTPPEMKVLFRYRLAGTNESWTATSQKELQFANLAPGSYRLEIQALDDRDGVWSEHQAEFPFRILAPWYWSWWFVGVCILTPVLAVAGVLRLRMLSAQKRERELVWIVEERTADLQRANEELLKLSLTDPLTGLANRRVFNQTLESECSRLKRSAAVVSLIMLDVDHFKALNDSKGHQCGDDYLVALGAVLNRIARRKIDVAARCGGEEFALILPGTNAADAVHVAERVRLAILDLKLLHPASPVAPLLTISAGVATGTQNALNTPEALVAAADKALYDAKRNGRNRVEVAQL